MNFEYVLIVAFMFAYALPFNLSVILFFLRARENDTFCSYLVVFCYALVIVAIDVCFVCMLVTHAKTYIPS
jgi:hypothetical protein